MASTLFSGPSSLTPWLENAVCEFLIHGSEADKAKHPPKLVLLLTDGSLSDGTHQIAVNWKTPENSEDDKISLLTLLPRREHLPCMARISHWQVRLASNIPQLHVNEFSIVGGHGIPPAKNLIHVCDTINVRRALQHYHYLNGDQQVSMHDQLQQHQATDKEALHLLGDVAALLAPGKSVVEQFEKQLRQQEESSWRYTVFSVDDRSNPVHVIENMDDFHKIVSSVMAQYEKEQRQAVTPPPVNQYQTKAPLDDSILPAPHDAEGAAIEPKAMMMQEEILTDSEDDETDVYKELGITKLLRLPSRDEMDEMAMQDIHPNTAAGLLEEDDDEDNEEMLATQQHFRIAPQVSEEMLPSPNEHEDNKGVAEEFHVRRLFKLNRNEYLPARGNYSAPLAIGNNDDDYLSATQEEVELDPAALHDDEEEEEWFTQQPPAPSRKRHGSLLLSATTRSTSKRTKPTMERWQTFLNKNETTANNSRKRVNSQLGGDSIRALLNDLRG